MTDVNGLKGTSAKKKKEQSIEISERRARYVLVTPHRSDPFLTVKRIGIIRLITADVLSQPDRLQRRRHLLPL